MKPIDRTKAHTVELIKTKETLGRSTHVMKCPKCGKIAASASERNMLPNWTTCIGLSYFAQRRIAEKDVSDDDLQFARSLYTGNPVYDQFCKNLDKE